MPTRRKNKSLAIALGGFPILVILTWTHRALTFPILLPDAAGLRAVLEAFFVGALSDLWIAYLLTVVGWAVAAALGGRIFPFWLVFLALLTAAHQAYVEFFHFQVIPAHIAYLGDADFLSANVASMVDWKPLLILLVFVVAALIINKFKFTELLDAGRVAPITLAALTVVCTYGHNRNIRYRVQWFVPESLQMQGLESLYVKWQHYAPPTPLSKAERTALATALGAPPAASTFAMLTQPPMSADKVALALRDAFRTSRAAGRKPVVAVVLMESLRPSEVGYFDQSKEKKPSLTPQLDALAARGAAFTQAYSTGSVTRGGQEAVLCGYLGSRDASLMRGNSLASIKCLPEELAASDPRTAFFWYHGGEGRFDGQLAFWKARRARDQLSLEDFGKGAARTGWGVGDRTFFAHAYEKLRTLRTDPAYDAFVGMFLSVTNHIPWLMPADAPPALQRAPRADEHPSWLTTRYADVALGDLVDRAKKDGLWDDLLLLVVSDHGNNVEPYADLYGQDPVRAVKLQSHINFVVTGGLAERTIATGLTVAAPRSQTDVAALIAFIFGIDAARFMGEVPFGAARRLPVLADLEENVYFPAENTVLTRKEAAGPGDGMARAYYRLFLEFIATK